LIEAHNILNIKEENEDRAIEAQKMMQPLGGVKTCWT
jgi:hypothetical protein